MNGPRQHTREFRAEAVRLCRTSGRGLEECAGQFGVSTESLRKWAKQVDIDDGAAPGMTSDVKDELSRLRRDNKILQGEKEILHKAVLSLAHRTDPPR